MALPPCARCGDGTRATVHLRATGYGGSADEDVCQQHLDDARHMARRHPNRVETLLVDDGQGSLFDMLGGGE